MSQNIQYHILRVVGGPDIQEAVAASLLDNDNGRWAENRLGLDYSRVSSQNILTFIQGQIREDQNVVQTGVRTMVIDDDEIHVNGRVGLLARAINARRQLNGNGGDLILESPRRTRPIINARPQFSDDSDSDGEPAPKLPTSGKRRGRPSNASKKEISDESDSDGEPKRPAAQKKRRGRPPTNKPKSAAVVIKKSGKGRGRPPKHAKIASAETVAEEANNSTHEESNHEDDEDRDQEMEHSTEQQVEETED